MCYIVQVCCLDCRRFESFVICCSNDYKDFIRNYFKDFKEYAYFIYDKFGNDIDFFDGVDL